MAERAKKSLESAARDGSSRSPRSSEEPRSPSMRLNPLPTPSPSHRHSFSDHIRGVPPSPRSSRQFSLSSIAIQDLLNNPPKAGSADPAFLGRDWHGISVSELVDAKDVRFVGLDTGIEDATNVCPDLVLVDTYTPPTRS